MRSIATDPDNGYISVTDFDDLHRHVDRVINQIRGTDTPSTPSVRTPDVSDTTRHPQGNAQQNYTPLSPLIRLYDCILYIVYVISLFMLFFLTNIKNLRLEGVHFHNGVAIFCLHPAADSNIKLQLFVLFCVSLFRMFAGHVALRLSFRQQYYCLFVIRADKSLLSPSC